MNTPVLHGILEGMRKGSKQILNAMKVGEPESVVDCTPDNGFGNFTHLLDGDALVFCQLANSTPYKGFKVMKGFKPLVDMNARTRCVFDRHDIKAMEKVVVGTRIVGSHNSFYRNMHGGFDIGEVVDASILKDKYNGEKYDTLCILCWIGNGMVEKFTHRCGCMYLSFGICISQETCCMCGATSHKGSPCNHVSESYSSSYSICRFKKFNEIALEA